MALGCIMARGGCARGWGGKVHGAIMAGVENEWSRGKSRELHERERDRAAQRRIIVGGI